MHNATEIERGYEKQGYKLPPEYDWSRVAEVRHQYGIEPIYVPVAIAPGVHAWGVPFGEDGKPMRHTS